MNYLIAHLVGDYLLQNDWMAQGKKTSSWICTVHVSLYMLPFMFLGLTWWQMLLIGTQHYFQDRFNSVQWYMRLIGQKEFARPPMAPWSVIVVDNAFHLLWISLVVWMG